MRDITVARALYYKVPTGAIRIIVLVLQIMRLYTELTVKKTKRLQICRPPTLSLILLCPWPQAAHRQQKLHEHLEIVVERKNRGGKELRLPRIWAETKKRPR